MFEVVYQSNQDKGIGYYTREQIEYLKKLLAERKIELEISDEAKEHLAIQGYNPMYGARPLKRLLKNKLENKLALAILEGKVKDFSTTRKISFDTVVETMYRTGKDLNAMYRETSQGGLAVLYHQGC